MKLQVTYDPEARCAYVRVGAPRTSVRQAELDRDTIADYDERDEIVGVEFLGVSEPELVIHYRYEERPKRRQRQDVPVNGTVL